MYGNFSHGHLKRPARKVCTVSVTVRKYAFLVFTWAIFVLHRHHFTHLEADRQLVCTACCRSMRDSNPRHFDQGAIGSNHFCKGAYTYKIVGANSKYCTTFLTMQLCVYTFNRPITCQPFWISVYSISPCSCTCTIVS